MTLRAAPVLMPGSKLALPRACVPGASRNSSGCMHAQMPEAKPGTVTDIIGCLIDSKSSLSPHARLANWSYWSNRSCKYASLLHLSPDSAVLTVVR